MSDKARRLYPLAAVFSPGEQPTGAKLSAISTQAKAAIDKLEFMTGDLWNAAGDLMLSPTGNITANALHIPNIARVIGKMSSLNTMVPVQGPLDVALSYSDSIGTRYANQNQGWLTYKSASTPTQFNMILGGTFAPLVQGLFQSNPNEVLGTGEWSVTPDGKLYAFDLIPSTLKLVYTPDIRSVVTSTSGTNESGWNVIPDPSTWSGAYSGVKISFANNTDATDGYHIWLPPRKPLTGSRLIYNSFASGSDNIQASPDVGTILPFQSTASNASLTNGNHYRYTLPAEITTGAANSRLPTGFIYLWDEQFGTIIDGAAYYTPANTAHKKFKIRVTGADLANVFGNTIGGGIITDDTTQLPADYIARFKVITTGVSLAKAVSSLIAFAANHVHKNTDGSKAIPHANLDNLVTPPGGDLYPTSVPAFTVSQWVNDDHLQYLHRGGSTASSTRKRDAYNNCMFNWLIVRNNITNTDVSINVAASGVEIASAETPLFLDAIQTGRSSSYPLVFIGEGTIPGGWLIDNDNLDSMTIRGGGTTGIAQIVNGQFQKMYLGLDTSFDRNTSYLEWVDADNILYLLADSAPGSVSFITDNIVVNETLSVPFDGYTIESGLIGYFDLSPTNIVHAQDGGASATYYIMGHRVDAVHSAGIFEAFIPVRLPDGVFLGTYPMSIAHRLAGGSTGDADYVLYYYVKPTSNGFSTPSLTALSTLHYASSATVGNFVATAAISSHTVNNTLNSYFFKINLPPQNAGDYYSFTGGTIKYDMSYLAP